MHGYFKIDNVLYHIVSNTSLSMFNICVPAISMACPWVSMPYPGIIGPWPTQHLLPSSDPDLRANLFSSHWISRYSKNAFPSKFKGAKIEWRWRSTYDHETDLPLLGNYYRHHPSKSDSRKVRLPYASPPYIHHSLPQQSYIRTHFSVNSQEFNTK